MASPLPCAPRMRSVGSPPLQNLNAMATHGPTDAALHPTSFRRTGQARHKPASHVRLRRYGGHEGTPPACTDKERDAANVADEFHSPIPRPHARRQGAASRARGPSCVPPRLQRPSPPCAFQRWPLVHSRRRTDQPACSAAGASLGMGQLKFRDINARYVLCPARGEHHLLHIYTSEKKRDPSLLFLDSPESCPPAHPAARSFVW